MAGVPANVSKLVESQHIMLLGRMLRIKGMDNIPNNETRQY